MSHIERREVEAHSEDRKDLIAKILHYQDLDSLLRLSVVLCDLELDGDGASLFLRQQGQNDLVLKESTVLTRFLGQPWQLDPELERGREIARLLAAEGRQPGDLGRVLSERDVEQWPPELVDRTRRFGLTRWAVQFRCPLAIEEIHRDIRWSSAVSDRLVPDRATDRAGGPSWIPLQHCELGRQEIGSIVILAFGPENEKLPRGVLRVVRRKERAGFTEHDLDWLEWFAGEIQRHMDVAVSLTDLMDMGTKLEIGDFGESLVKLLQRGLKVRGCSIFLELQRDQDERIREFQCIATTGLYLEGRRIPKEEAKYRVDMSRQQVDSLTGWVLRNGQLLARSSSAEGKELSFPGLSRKPGGGTYKETEADEKTGGPLLISPLFLHQGREVAGAIRVVRPRDSGEDFEDHEQLFFLDISRRLSRVLTNINLRQVSEELIGLYHDPEELLQRVPREVNRLLGVEGCSVFRLHAGNRLELAATQGKLEHLEEKIVYDISNPDERGWTGWVAFYKRALRLNSPGEEKQYLPDPPKHSPQELDRPCEVSDRSTYRFLCVPIFRHPADPTSEVLGVIRAPRRRVDMPFEESHQSILVSFAARLSLALNLSERASSLKAVADLADVDKIIAKLDRRARLHPQAVAEAVVRQVTEILVEEMGLAYGAVYELDERTEEPSLMVALPAEARSTPDDGSMVYECDVHLGTIQLGKLVCASYRERPLTEHQKMLAHLLAGVCASALYNRAVNEKLETIRKGLVDVGEKMTGDGDLGDKLKVITEVAAGVTLADNVIIHEYLEPKEHGARATDGRFRETACGGPEMPGLWKNTSQPGAIPFRVVSSRKPFFAVEAKDSLLYHKKDGPNFIDREGILSVAALPLMVGGSNTCVGCIFFNYRRRQFFSKQRRSEIEMMADYAAMAIFQGRLLASTQHLVETKSNLLRYAAHSLAQPLNALWNYLGNLADGIYYQQVTATQLASKKDFEQSVLAGTAQSQYELCRYIVHLVRHFLEIDELEAEGRLEDQRLFEVDRSGPGNLTKVCEMAVAVTEAYRGSKIEREIERHVEGRFDDDAIKMAIINVLVNAVKSVRGSEDGRPGIVELTLSSRRRGHTRWAEVAIEDSGPGVPVAEREKIFDMGFTKRPKSPGLGIGLYLAKGYVEAHGGSIEVGDSKFPSSLRVDGHRHGARFTISLPLDATE